MELLNVSTYFLLGSTIQQWFRNNYCMQGPMLFPLLWRVKWCTNHQLRHLKKWIISYILWWTHLWIRFKSPLFMVIYYPSTATFVIIYWGRISVVSTHTCPMTTSTAKTWQGYFYQDKLPSGGQSRPRPGSHWSDFCSYSVVFPRMSCKVTHTVLGLPPFHFPGIMLLKFIHNAVHIREFAPFCGRAIFHFLWTCGLSLFLAIVTEAADIYVHRSPSGYVSSLLVNSRNDCYIVH